MKDLRLLIIDDDAGQLDRLAGKLSAAQPQLRVDTVAGDGASPVAVQSGRYDVALVQIPPGATANELLEAYEGLGCPIVVYSTCRRQETAIECFRAGAADFIPLGEAVDGGQMLGRIEAVLQRQQAPAPASTHRERRQSELLRMAERDPLTGLFNRRYLEHRLHRGGYRNDRRRHMACVFLDLDRFKQVNDEFGHAAGDQVLQTVAQVLLARCGGGDAAMRWGGEEFVVLKSSADLAAGWAWAESVRTDLASRTFSAAAERFGVTASFGVVSFPTRQMSYDAIDQADRAMLLAKRQGRNRVCTGPMVSVDRILRQVARNQAAVGDLRWAQFVKGCSEILGPAQMEHLTRHSRRVEAIAVWLGCALDLPSLTVESLRLAGLHHDLGKCLVPEAVLSQAGPLSSAQWQLMRSHPALGAEMAAVLGVGRASTEAIRGHHDRYDTPRLPGGRNLGASILAVADALAAMRMPRPHRPARTTAEALAELDRGSGGQFHPVVVKAALRASRSLDAATAA